MAKKTSRYLDLDLNFLPHPLTKDVGRLSDSDAINMSVKNLILFNVLDKYQHPEIASGVSSHLGGLSSLFTSADIRTSILQVLQNFEPRINVIDIMVIPFPDQNMYQITIKYGIQNIADPFQLTIPLYQVR